MQWLWIPVVIAALVIGKLIWLREADTEREKIIKEVRKELYAVRDEILQEIRRR